MKTRHRLFVLATSLVLACTMAVAATSKAKPKKWIDKDGVVHYGDTVPPEYVSQGYEELNAQGVPKVMVPRQPTREEADAAARAAAEEKKSNARDAFLLHSYTRWEEIAQLRDERIALIESQMELARTSIAGTDQRLAAQQARLRNFRPYSSSANAQRVPDRLAAEVVRTMSERRSMVTQLGKYEEDKAKQQATFDSDISRYKELTKRH